MVIKTEGRKKKLKDTHAASKVTGSVSITHPCILHIYPFWALPYVSPFVYAFQKCVGLYFAHHLVLIIILRPAVTSWMLLDSFCSEIPIYALSAVYYVEK